MSVKRRRLWVSIGLLVILAISAVLYLCFAGTPANTLQPGGFYSGTGGVSFAAPAGALECQIEIQIEPVDDPRTEVPFPDYLKKANVLGNFYEITSPQEHIFTGESPILLGLPVPGDLSIENLGIALLSPPEAILSYYPDESPPERWSILSGVFDPESNLFVTTFLYVGDLPQVVALVETEGYSNSAYQNQGELNGGDLSRAVRAPPSNTVTFHSTGSLTPGSTGLLLFSAPLIQQYSSPAGTSLPAGDAATLLAGPADTPSVFSEDLEGFHIRCWGFDDGECTDAHRQSTVNALEEAYELWIDLGFNKPRLRQVLLAANMHTATQYSSNMYEYQLHKDAPNGRYYILQGYAYTSYPGDPEAPDPRTARHELFHAFQYSYEQLFENRRNNLWGLIEGSAVASELSMAELTRSNAQREDSEGNIVRMLSREPISINVRLLHNYLDADDIAWATANDYRTQDFWVYLGMRMNPANPTVSFLIPFLQRGGLLEDIDAVLQEEGTFESLADAYWQWVKNHSFEKQVILGLDHDGEQVPHGPPGSWSGHGSLNFLQRDPLDLAGDGPEAVFTGYRVHPFTSRVHSIILDPSEYRYEVTVTLAGNIPQFYYKLYVQNEYGELLDESADCSSYTFIVDQEPAHVFILVSNTGMDSSSAQYRVQFQWQWDAEGSVSPPHDNITDLPAHELKYRLAVTSGPPGVSIDSSTGHGGITDYTIRDIPAGTVVSLAAPEYVGSGSSRERFSHWSGPVSGKERSITLAMDNNMSVKAHYIDDPVTYTLTVSSNVDDLKNEIGVDIDVDVDLNSEYIQKKTPFSIVIIAGRWVKLIAQDFIVIDGIKWYFDGWTGIPTGSGFKNYSITFQINNNINAKAYYREEE